VIYASRPLAAVPPLLYVVRLKWRWAIGTSCVQKPPLCCMARRAMPIAPSYSLHSSDIMRSMSAAIHRRALAGSPGMSLEAYGPAAQRVWALPIGWPGTPHSFPRGATLVYYSKSGDLLP